MRTLHVWIIRTYTVYISKSVFTLIDTRIRSISELYSGAGMRPAISICRRVCTYHHVCVSAGRIYARERTPTRYRAVARESAASCSLGSLSLSRPASSLRRMRYNLDIPYIHVQDMPPILNIPSCNS